MTPRLVARYFGEGWWPRMAAVLEYSARLHCPGWRLDIARMEPPDPNRGAAGAVANRAKLQAWADAVDAADDGEELLLCDVDVAILQALDPVWAIPFDLAVTWKQEPRRYPLNAGVIFIRVSEASRAAMAAWNAEDQKQFEQPGERQCWTPYYGGFNQASFGALLRTRRLEELRLARLPCGEWNCEDEHWHQFGAGTRILHLKGPLFRALTGRGGRQVVAPDGTVCDLRPLVARWLELEQAAKAERPSELERRREAPVAGGLTPEAPETTEGDRAVPADPVAAPPLEDTMVRPTELRNRRRGARRRPPVNPQEGDDARGA